MRNEKQPEVIPVNEGLPEGAKKFIDQDVDNVLSDIRNEEANLYNSTGFCTRAGLIGDGKVRGLEEYETEVSNQDSILFNCQTSPDVEGRSWYRGIAVKVGNEDTSASDEKLVIIFSGWMQPWLKDGAPIPIVYTRGGVSKEKVLEVVTKYSAGMMQYIDGPSTQKESNFIKSL